MKSMVKTKQMLAMLVFVTLIFLGCKKENPQPVDPPKTVSLSLGSIPLAISDKITVEYGDSVIINANSSGNTITWNKSDVTYTSSAQFKLKGLTESTQAVITAKNAFGVTETKTMAVTVTPPSQEMLNLIGKWRIIEAWTFDRTINDPEFMWRKAERDDRDNKSFYETIYTFHLDKSFTVYDPYDTDRPIGYQSWKIVKQPDGKVMMTQGFLGEILELTSTRLIILNEVQNPTQENGLRSARRVFQKIQ